MYSLEQEDQVRGELSYISCLDMINGCLPSSSQSFPWPSWWIPKLCSDTIRINIHDNMITQKYFTRIVVCMAHTAIMEQSQWVNVLSPVTHLFPHLKQVNRYLTYFCLCTYNSYSRVSWQYKVEKHFKLLHKQDNEKTNRHNFYIIWCGLTSVELLTLTVLNQSWTWQKTKN